MSVGFQLSLGLVVPVVGLIWKSHLPALVGPLFFVTATLPYVLDYPLKDVAIHDACVESCYRHHFRLAVSSRNDRMVVLWRFCLFTSLVCGIFACEELFSRLYPVHPHQTSPPKPLSKLITPKVTPTVSDDAETSGITRDHGTDDEKWEECRDRDCLFASVCDSRCVFIYANQKNQTQQEGAQKPLCSASNFTYGWRIIFERCSGETNNIGSGQCPTLYISPRPIYSRS